MSVIKTEIKADQETISAWLKACGSEDISEEGYSTTELCKLLRMGQNSILRHLDRMLKEGSVEKRIGIRTGKDGISKRVPVYVLLAPIPKSKKKNIRKRKK